MPAPDLSSFKVAAAEVSSATKFNNLVQAVQDEFGDIDADQIPGYPSDATKFLRGDGAWAATGAMVILGDIDLTATQQFAAITGIYRHLVLRYHGRASNGGNPYESVRIRFNGDSGANYEVNVLASQNNAAITTYTSGLTYADFGVVVGSTGTANRAGFGEGIIPVYSGTSFQKIVGATSYTIGTAAAANAWVQFRTSHWANTAAITQIDILMGVATTWASGSRAQLYGVN